jgi:predicted nucleotidyltransferase
MSIDLLERGAAALRDFLDEVVFVGGATVSLWITDPAAPPSRPTKDVDVIVEVATRGSYYSFEERLRAAGFRDDEEVICRWHRTQPDLILDAIPIDAALLGFVNEWQRRAFPHGTAVPLPSGVSIQAIPPAFLIATKLEAYAGRGDGDLLGSRDWADIVALADGREELVGDIREAPEELTDYVARAIAELLGESRVIEGIRAQLLPDAISQSRAEEIVLPRLREVANLGPAPRLRR